MSGPSSGSNHARLKESESKATSRPDRKSTRLNSSHPSISYAVFCLKKKNKDNADPIHQPNLLSPTPQTLLPPYDIVSHASCSLALSRLPDCYLAHIRRPVRSAIRLL